MAKFHWIKKILLISQWTTEMPNDDSLLSLKAATRDER